MLRHISFLSLALLLAACTSTGVDSPADPVDPSPQDKADMPVSFSTYVAGEKQSRGTRAEGTTEPTATTTGIYGDIASIDRLRELGFGVFGYYTGANTWASTVNGAAGATVGATTKPNFMYNQSVTWNADKKLNSAGQTPDWLYEPVKFWPNGESTAASGKADDKVSFFAYAPWVASGSSRTSVSSKATVTPSLNSATGSPKITYTVATNPSYSIDLLWGVKPSGLPYLDQTKPGNSENIDFLFKHALSKIQILMFGNFGSSLSASDSTMVLLKDVKVTLPVPQKGTLDLCNTQAGVPAWDKSTFEFETADDNAATTGYNEKNTSTLYLEKDIPDSLKDLDYGGNGTTDKDELAKAKADWQKRFNGGKGGIRNNKNFYLHKGAFMVIPPDSDDITAMPAGERVMKIEVTYTVQTIDYRLPKHYWRHEETLTAYYPIHRIKAGMAYTIRLGLSLSQVDVTVQTETWKEPVVFTGSVEDLDDNSFDIDPTPDSTQ